MVVMFGASAASFGIGYFAAAAATGALWRMLNSDIAREMREVDACTAPVKCAGVCSLDAFGVVCCWCAVERQRLPAAYLPQQESG